MRRTSRELQLVGLGASSGYNLSAEQFEWSSVVVATT
jgi:hypothetical protein